MEIIYAGGSHYGVGAYRSLHSFFSKIFLPSCNPDEILALKRSSDVLIGDFDDVDCKYVFLGGYPHFIQPCQLERKTYINVHGALLPKYRGMHPTFWAIMNGEKNLGVTFHLVNEAMDAGAILRQFEFEYVGQTVQEINDTIDTLIEEHAGEVLSQYINGNIQPVPQNPELVVYGARRNLEDCVLDFSLSHNMIGRFFQALTRPYPLPMLSIRGQKFEILDHHLVRRDYYGPLGRVVNIDREGVWIKTKDGYLIVQQVQSLQSGRKEKLSSLVKTGYRFDIPQKFEGA